MPTVHQHNTQTSKAMTSSFNFKTKHQNGPHIDSFFQAKEINLIRHIESLKVAANAPLLFPNLNNSARPNGSLLSIANSGEHTDVSLFKSKSQPLSLAIDPASVAGNLRKQSRNAEPGDKTLSVEDIISRGSSVSMKTPENEDDVSTVKSRVKARRKSNKSLKKKTESSESSLSRSLSFNAHSKFSLKHQNSKSIDNKDLDLDALSALCKGITIQEKSNTISVKTSPYVRKSPSTHHSHHSTLKSSNGGSKDNCKKIAVSSDNLHHARRRSLGNKTSAEDVKTVKVFQSDQQSGVINDLGLAVPCAPPATPTPDQLRKYEYIPSLQDVRAQRAFRQRLQAMEIRANAKEARKLESNANAEKLSLKEKKQQLKRFQRQQIYALNKVMTDLEYERFRAFMEGAGSVSGGV